MYEVIDRSNDHMLCGMFDELTDAEIFLQHLEKCNKNNDYYITNGKENDND